MAPGRRSRRVIRIAAVTLVACGSAWAQSLPDPHRIDEGYDGRFRFVRLRWDSGMAFGRRGMSNAWNHDFPRAEQNLARILEFVTLVDVNPEGRILRLSDPELFNHPIVYMWEPGFWVMTDNEAQRFREYLLKGGFAIFDDFEYDQWNNLEAQMRRVLPEARWVELDASHRVFDSFFRMTDIDFPHPMYGIKPTYYGIFENNDPNQRMMAMVAYNGDLAEYWEYAATGFFPVDPTSDSFRIGVNFFIYGMTR